MKKIAILAIAFLTFTANAQQEDSDRKDLRKERMSKMKDMNPEDMAQLQTKKMTLELDLTKAQQNKVNALNLSHAKASKAKMEKRQKAKKEHEKRSQEEHVKMMNERLDAQIANKKEMKAILNAEQYAKWEKMRASKHKRKMHKKKHRKHEKRKEGESHRE